jgi:hypothetical protein
MLLRAALRRRVWRALELSERSPVKERGVELHCGAGIATLADGWDEHVSVYRPGWVQRGGRADGELPSLTELRAFVDHLRSSPPSKSSAAEGAVIVETIAELPRSRVPVDRCHVPHPDASSRRAPDVRFAQRARAGRRRDRSVRRRGRCGGCDTRCDGAVPPRCPVRFFDFPKGERLGEAHRHVALQEPRGRIVTYLSDDDLLLPSHVAEMSRLLVDANFAHPIPGRRQSGWTGRPPTDRSLAARVHRPHVPWTQPDRPDRRVAHA